MNVTTGRLRALLAVLAMSAGRAVSVERLAAAMWGADRPDRPRRSVQTYLARLRVVLGVDAIRTRPDGYQLDADQVDALRFVEILDAAATARDGALERAELVKAEALWRGVPFDGIRAVWLEEVEAPRLTGRYLDALERRIDLDLDAGLHGVVQDELRDLTTRYPLRERFWAQLMTALYRSGRQAEALESYQRLYRVLAEELGVSPGPAVRELQRQVLARDAVLQAQPETVRPVTPTPRQLPSDLDHFTGRTEALARLDRALSRITDSAAIAVVGGAPGMGATALAVHWAHRVLDRFPDGQLYVDLRGFDPLAAPLRPSDVLRGFLEALGVHAERMPDDLPARIGLYRSLLAGRRMLILLDNAEDAGQVRPLLPGAPGCAAVVTSRRELLGLVAEGAHPVGLSPLAAGEVRELLDARLGRARVTAEPEAADRLIRLCAGLPLAVVTVAERARSMPHVGLDTLARELAQVPVAPDLRDAFSLSYAALGPAAGRLFRILGLHPGPDISTAAAASLAGVSVAEVRHTLAELCRAHLLTEHSPGRFTGHELLRAYATELLDTHDSDEDRRAAQHRIFDHYLGTASAAALRIEPLRDSAHVRPDHLDAAPQRFTGAREALAWFETELPVVLNVARAARAGGLDAYTCQFAWALTDFLSRQGRWHTLAATLTDALTAARRCGCRAGQAWAHRRLGTVSGRLARYESAHTHVRRALNLYRELDDAVGLARTHQGLADILERQADDHRALRHARRAVDLYPTEADIAEAGRLRTFLGWCHARLGHLPQALGHCDEALTIARQADDRIGAAAALDSLGYIHHRLGRWEQALAHYHQALDLRREMRHRGDQANIWVRIGDTQVAMGDWVAARASWGTALRVVDKVGESDVEQSDGEAMTPVPGRLGPAAPEHDTRRARRRLMEVTR